MIRQTKAAALVAALLTLLGVLAVGDYAQAAGAGRLRAHGSGGAPPAPSVLTPGAGWSGATAQPASQGSSSDFGYNDLAVGYWDQPQFMTATGDLEIGVWAYHANSIAQVDIACDGGSWVTITTPSANPDADGVNVPTSYHATLHSTAFADAQHDCRAILWPTTGKPLVLQGVFDPSQFGENVVSIHSLWISTNAHGGLWGPSSTGGFRYVASSGSDTTTCGLTSGAPCLTAYGAGNAATLVAPNSDIGGTVICFQEGTGYSLGGTTANFIRNAATQYVTMEPCPGANPANIHFTVDGSMRSDRLHYKDLILQSTPGVTNLSFDCSPVGTAQGRYPIIWLDHVTYVGPSYTLPSGAVGSGCTGGRFISNSDLSNSSDGPTGSNWVRGITIHDIGSDALSNIITVAGATIYNIDTEYHAYGDSVAGSPLVTNLTTMANFYAGGSILTGNIYGATVADPVNILCTTGNGSCAADPANSLRLAINAKGTATSQYLVTGSHGDVYQTDIPNLSTRHNVLFANVTATDHIEAQGQFLSRGDLADYATINVNLNNQNPNFNTERVWDYGAGMDNAFVKNSTYVGGMNYIGAPGDFHTTGFSWIGNTFGSCPASLGTANPPAYALANITRANPAVVTTTAANTMLTGDGVNINTQGAGMSQVNNQYYKITVLSSTTFSLQDLDGNNIDSTGYAAYTSGGQVNGPFTPHGVRMIGNNQKCY